MFYKRKIHVNISSICVVIKYFSSKLYFSINYYLIRLQKLELIYVQKVLHNFVVDISLQLLEQFQQTNSHFKEHVKVYLLYKNDGSSLRNKRDI